MAKFRVGLVIFILMLFSAPLVLFNNCSRLEPSQTFTSLRAFENDLPLVVTSSSQEVTPTPTATATPVAGPNQTAPPIPASPSPAPTPDAAFLGRLVVSKAASGEMYFAHEGQVLKFSGANLMNEVLQPSLDYLMSLGGGRIDLEKRDASNPFRLTGVSVRGKQINFKGLYENFGIEIEFFDNIIFEGAKNADGGPGTVISIDSVLGNIFAAESKSNVSIRNLEIRANEFGNYIFSTRRCRNFVYENIHVYYPNWAAFGHTAGTNIAYNSCKAFGKSPKYGHGWAVGGNFKGMRDTNTTIRNAEASGFAHPEGGQGIDIRPVLTEYGMDPSLTNSGVKILGGNFSRNLVGIAVYGSADAEVANANVFDNAIHGIEIHPGYSTSLGRPEPAISSIAAWIHGNNLTNNGNNSRTPRGAGLYIAASNSGVYRNVFTANLPFNVSVEGFKINLQENTLQGGSAGQPYQIFFGDPDGGTATGTLIGNSVSPTIYSFSEGDASGFSSP